MNFLKKIFTRTNITSSTLTVSSSNGFHLRPIAQFVNEAKKYEETITLIAKQKEVSATQVAQILSLSLEEGDSFTLKVKGKASNSVNEKLTSFFKKLMESDSVVEEIIQDDTMYESPSLKGQTIAKGIAIAPLANYRLVETIEESSVVSLREAINKTKRELHKKFETYKTEESSQIFLAQKELLSSDIFEHNFSNINEFKDTIQKETQKLQNTKFESRIADYQDLEQKVLTHLGVQRKLELPLIPYILVAKELLPSHIEQLKQTPIKGVILQSGMTTSHAAILLRSAAIPSLIIQEKIEKSNKAILDANSGQLILKPTTTELKQAKLKQQKFQEAVDRSFEKRLELTQTQKGQKIDVLANITNLISAKEAKGLGADGIGLLRTEFLFTQKKPTVEEQTETYKEIFEIFDNVTVRTLDIGGDKSLPYINIEKEDNPFLGIRGIRFSLQEQTLFKEQLLAIFQAVNLISSNKRIKIMFPMVSTTQEFLEAKEISQTIAKENNLNISNIQFGIMLEVPSVIFALKEFDLLVDFYSIGSNDLTQYLFAIERTHPTLQVDATSPLLMNTLKYIKENTLKPMSICGELAGLEEATQELINMGYSSLSVSAKQIPSIKEQIRTL